MPLRLISSELRQTAHELRILSFLAPRVFASWPTSLHRSRYHRSTCPGIAKPNAASHRSLRDHGVPKQELRDTRKSYGRFGRDFKPEFCSKQRSSSGTNSNLAYKLSEQSLTSSDEQSLENVTCPNTGLQGARSGCLDVYDSSIHMAGISRKMASGAYTQTSLDREKRLSRNYSSSSRAVFAPILQEASFHSHDFVAVNGSSYSAEKEPRRMARANFKDGPHLHPTSQCKPTPAEIQAQRRWNFRRTMANLKGRQMMAASKYPNKVVKPRINSFVRLHHEDLSIDGLDSLWNVNFSRLKTEAEMGMPYDLRRGYDERRSKILVLHVWNMSCKTITREWSKIPPLRRRRLWRIMMISILARDHVVGLKFLVATMFRPYPPGYAISDALEFIVGQFLDKEDKSHPRNVQPLLSILLRLLHHAEEDYFHLSSNTVRKLLQFLNGEQLVLFYQQLVECKHPLHPHTAAHFITTCAETKQTRLALDCMQWLRGKNWVDFSRPLFEAVCTTLLRHNNRSSSHDAPSDSEIFSVMLDCGLQPNIVTYNVLLLNAIEAGDSDTAMQIHSMMAEDGVVPNDHTYSILLNDAKRRMDRSEIYRVFDIAARSEMLSSHSVTDFIHSIFLMGEEDQRAVEDGGRIGWKDSMIPEPPDLPFKRMLEVYGRFFDTRFIEELIPDGASVPAPDATKWRPSKELLATMLIALFKELKSNVAIQFVYDKFREQIAKKNPDFVALSHSTHVYDAVIMAFGRSETTLRRCTSVIRQMIVSHSQDRTHVAPTVRTWSILLKAFMDHRQPRAAEKVLKMIQERGIEPDLVTWNKLVGGYAKLQDTTSVLKAIGRLQSQGWELDGPGKRALQSLQDREALLLGLKAKTSGTEFKQEKAASSTANSVEDFVDRGHDTQLSAYALLNAGDEKRTAVEETDAVNTAGEVDTGENGLGSVANDNIVLNMDEFVFPLDVSK